MCPGLFCRVFEFESYSECLLVVIGADNFESSDFGGIGDVLSDAGTCVVVSNFYYA